MSWRVVEHRTVYRETGHYATAPNVVRTPAGELLVLFHRSPHLGHAHHSHPLFDVRAVASGDEGRTWSEPWLVTNDPRGGVIDFGTHTLADGSIFLHASSNELVPAAGLAEIAFRAPPHARDVGAPQHSTWVSRPGSSVLGAIARRWADVEQSRALSPPAGCRCGALPPSTPGYAAAACWRCPTVAC